MDAKYHVRMNIITALQQRRVPVADMGLGPETSELPVDYFDTDPVPGSNRGAGWYYCHTGDKKTGKEWVWLGPNAEKAVENARRGRKRRKFVGRRVEGREKGRAASMGEFTLKHVVPSAARIASDVAYQQGNPLLGAGLDAAQVTAALATRWSSNPEIRAAGGIMWGNAVGAAITRNVSHRVGNAIFGAKEQEDLSNITRPDFSVVSSEKEVAEEEVVEDSALDAAIKEASSG